jgi:hypothetical protein
MFRCLWRLCTKHRWEASESAIKEYRASQESVSDRQQTSLNAAERHALKPRVGAACQAEIAIRRVGIPSDVRVVRQVTIRRPRVIGFSMRRLESEVRHGMME